MSAQPQERLPGKEPPFRPIIDDSTAPLLARIRDVALTLLAWAVLCWFLREVLLLAYHMAQYALGVVPRMPSLQTRAIVDDLVPFLKLVGLLFCWLATFAMIRWRRLHARQRAIDPPGPLEIERHAGQWQLPVEQVLATRDAGRAVARFGDNGKLAGLDIVDGPQEKSLPRA